MITNIIRIDEKMVSDFSRVLSTLTNIQEINMNTCQDLANAIAPILNDYNFQQTMPQTYVKLQELHNILTDQKMFINDKRSFMKELKRAIEELDKVATDEMMNYPSTFNILNREYRLLDESINAIQRQRLGQLAELEYANLFLLGAHVAKHIDVSLQISQELKDILGRYESKYQYTIKEGRLYWHIKNGALPQIMQNRYLDYSITEQESMIMHRFLDMDSYNHGLKRVNGKLQNTKENLKQMAAMFLKDKDMPVNFDGQAGVIVALPYIRNISALRTVLAATLQEQDLLTEDVEIRLRGDNAVLGTLVLSVHGETVFLVGKNIGDIDKEKYITDIWATVFLTPRAELIVVGNFTDADEFKKDVIGKITRDIVPAINQMHDKFWISRVAFSDINNLPDESMLKMKNLILRWNASTDRQKAAIIAELISLYFASVDSLLLASNHLADGNGIKTFLQIESILDTYAAVEAYRSLTRVLENRRMRAEGFLARLNNIQYPTMKTILEEPGVRDAVITSLNNILNDSRQRQILMQAPQLLGLLLEYNLRQTMPIMRETNTYIALLITYITFIVGIGNIFFTTGEDILSVIEALREHIRGNTNIELFKVMIETENLLQLAVASTIANMSEKAQRLLNNYIEMLLYSAYK